MADKFRSADSPCCTLKPITAWGKRAPKPYPGSTSVYCDVSSHMARRDKAATLPNNYGRPKRRNGWEAHIICVCSRWMVQHEFVSSCIKTLNEKVHLGTTFPNKGTYQVCFSWEFVERQPTCAFRPGALPAETLPISLGSLWLKGFFSLLLSLPHLSPWDVFGLMPPTMDRELTLHMSNCWFVKIFPAEKTLQSPDLYDYLKLRWKSLFLSLKCSWTIVQVILKVSRDLDFDCSPSAELI